MDSKANAGMKAPWYEAWGVFEEPKAETQRQEHPLLIFVYSSLFMIGCLTVSVWVIWSCVHEWPTNLKVYKSNDAAPRPGYTCACSLPGDWASGPDAVLAKDTAVLHRCYEREKLETVTVLQYDPSINLLAPGMQHIMVNDRSSVKRNFTRAYEVEVGSRVSEITLTKGDPKGYFDSLHAYKGIESNTIDIPFDDILSSTGMLDIPNYFVRWGFEFDCTNCSACGPTQLQKKIPNFYSKEDTQWASCFAHGALANNCFQNNYYHGKCSLYPTSSVPPIFALKEFLNNFKSFQNITNIAGLNSGRGTPNALTLESSFIYLVENDVKEIPNISWGFMKVVEQDSWWLVLHNTYPNVSQECGKASKVQTCQLPKLCSSALLRLNQDDISHSHTSCIQQALDPSLCQDMVASTGMEIDNYDLLGDNRTKENQLTRICPKSLNCKQVLPNYITYKPPTNSRVIGIDSKNYIHGWCTKTYSGILRHVVNGSKFLETNCLNGLCYLTGRTSPRFTMLIILSFLISIECARYNQIDDVDGDFHTLPLSEYNPKSGEQPFVCYKAKKKSRMRWTIDTFGVLFGWIGTLQLVFVIILPILIGFMKRVDEDEDICLDSL